MWGLASPPEEGSSCGWAVREGVLQEAGQRAEQEVTAIIQGRGGVWERLSQGVVGGTLARLGGESKDAGGAVGSAWAQLG